MSDELEPKGQGLVRRKRLDLASVAGLVFAVAAVAGGLLLEGGRLSDIAQISAAVIVLGGTLGAVLLTTPYQVAIGAARRLANLPFEHQLAPSTVIDEIIVLARKARKGGMIALEQDLTAIHDPFLYKALKLSVDGTDLKHVRQMMDLEMRLELSEADTDARVWEAAGGYAPTIGILGAVIGLIQVMKHLDDLSKVGYGIAVAFVATIYGVGIANLFFLPVAQKLRLRAQQNLHTHQLMMEGVASIIEGMNPTLIRRKLEAFVRDPRQRRRRPVEMSPAEPRSMSA
jgi:chemotaxis protein MotA